jgi:hypothetical protein
VGLELSILEFSRRSKDWATLRGVRPVPYAETHMNGFLISLLHLAVTTRSCVAPVACER